MKETDLSLTAQADGYAIQTAGLTKRFGGGGRDRRLGEHPAEAGAWRTRTRDA